jgi:hypothetical protein
VLGLKKSSIFFGLGLNKIIGLKSALNVGIYEDLKLEFKNVIPKERPAYTVDSISLNPN